MTPIENYFFVNNIEVYSSKNTGIICYYSTSDGEYVENNEGKLFRFIGKECKEEILL